MGTTVRRLLNALQPVNHLPPEILSHIMHYASRLPNLRWPWLSGLHDSRQCCVLSSVCSQWREVALGFADLWNTIDPVHHPLTISTFLERSKASLLHLITNHLSNHTSDIQNIVKCSGHRICSLDCVFPPSHIDDAIRLANLCAGQLKALEFECLQELGARVLVDEGRLNQKLCSNFPRLRQLA